MKKMDKEDERLSRPKICDDLYIKSYDFYQEFEINHKNIILKCTSNAINKVYIYIFMNIIIKNHVKL